MIRRVSGSVGGLFVTCFSVVDLDMGIMTKSHKLMVQIRFTCGGGSFKYVLQNSNWFRFVKALPSYGLVETIILLAKWMLSGLFGEGYIEHHRATGRFFKVGCMYHYVSTFLYLTYIYIYIILICMYIHTVMPQIIIGI